MRAWRGARPGAPFTRRVRRQRPAPPPVTAAAAPRRSTPTAACTRAVPSGPARGKTDRAAAWLHRPPHAPGAVTSAAGRRHMIQYDVLRDRNIVVVTPESPLEEGDFAQLANAIDPLVAANGTLAGLMVCVRSFPGWASFAALTAHLRFVAEHHRKI